MKMEELTEQKKTKDNFDKLIAKGIPSDYVKFHGPVAPGKDKEPVFEFSLDKPGKYKVDSITSCPGIGIFYTAYGQSAFVPDANVVKCRLKI